MTKPRKVTPRAAEGARLRSARSKAMRWAERLKSMGYVEQARQIRETAGAIRAGRGRKYSDEAKKSAAQVEKAMRSQKSLHSSLARFHREERSFNRGMGGPLTQGIGLKNLMRFKSGYATLSQRIVHKDGSVTERQTTVERRRYAMKIRARIMTSVFYSVNKRGSMFTEDAVEALGMAEGSSSAVSAWRTFWRGETGQAAIKAADAIAEAIAQGKPLDKDLLWAKQTIEDIIGSPRSGGFLDRLWTTWQG